MDSLFLFINMCVVCVCLCEWVCKSQHADMFSSLIMSLSTPQSFLCRHVLSYWFPRLTHCLTFGEWMWLCGILTCLLTTEGVKHRTTSLLLHDHNACGLHHPLFLLSIHRQQTATSEEVLLAVCQRARKQALLSASECADMNLRPAPPPTSS